MAETKTRRGFRLPGSEALLRPDVAASQPKSH
jgi:hypothetical protein